MEKLGAVEAALLSKARQKLGKEADKLFPATSEAHDLWIETATIQSNGHGSTRGSWLLQDLRTAYINYHLSHTAEQMAIELVEDK